MTGWAEQGRLTSQDIRYRSEQMQHDCDSRCLKLVNVSTRWQHVSEHMSCIGSLHAGSSNRNTIRPAGRVIELPRYSAEAGRYPIRYNNERTVEDCRLQTIWSKNHDTRRDTSAAFNWQQQKWELLSKCLPL